MATVFRTGPAAVTVYLKRAISLRVVEKSFPWGMG